MTLRLAFMGSADFSLPVLDSLIEAGHEIACVYSQPPRPAGRGQKAKPCPVHARVTDLGLNFRIPKTLRSDDDQKAFSELKLDAAVVVAYGLILPQAILEAPGLGCINIHASLLPRWRGAAPIQRAIEAGDQETGITIMQMDAGLDTGDMLMTARHPITEETTGESLHDALSVLGAKMINPALADLANGTLKPVAQPETGITYANKLDKSEGQIEWAQPADTIARKIRAFYPWPGSYFHHGKMRLKVMAAKAEAGSGAPGTVLDDQLLVACGEGALRITTIQRPGKGPMSAKDLLCGYAIKTGEILR